MALLLKNAHVIDPQVGLNETADILIRDGKIVEIGQGLSLEKGVERDLAGKIVVPGLVDMHVHLREPGFEQKEDIASGTRAAAHGGFTAVCAMPNTNPVVDNAVAVEYVKSIAAQAGKCRVHVSGSCSQGLKGETLSEMGDMAAHGAVAFTDDGLSLIHIFLPDGSLDWESYERALVGASLVVATHASNVTGDVYDIEPVSYTHLDVYKRQRPAAPQPNRRRT